MVKIVRTDAELECPDIDAALQQVCDEYVLLPDGVPEERLIAETQDADLLLMCYTPITQSVIDRAQRLKGIVKYGVGIDAIDIPAAHARGIAVVNVPEYAEETVAESAFTLMLALAKKLVPMDREMHRSGWIWPTPNWLGLDLAEKTVGLVGVGRIGRSMARMAGLGFRARVIGFDPNVSAESMADAGVTKVDELGTLLQESDFVSVHCVLNADTKHLIGRSEFEMMKTSAFLVNVSRGAIVDEMALLDALQQNKIAGAGLDVYSQEPLQIEGHPLSQLYTMDNVILIPHLAFYTHEAMQRLTDDTLARCYEILEERPVTIKSSDPRLQVSR